MERQPIRHTHVYIASPEITLMFSQFLGLGGSSPAARQMGDDYF